MEEFTGLDNSLVNTREAEYVAKLLRKMEDNRVDPENIGIISPYVGQVDYLWDSMKYISGCSEHFLDNLEIDTIDAFQGREKEFIIFSCVRGNDKSIIGFLSNRERMNVALTRAKYGLIVVGNANSFAKSKDWSDFIEYCASHETLVEGNLDKLRPSVFERHDAPGTGGNGSDEEVERQEEQGVVRG
jgi:regulator of nonsense transcripts 1